MSKLSGWGVWEMSDRLFEDTTTVIINKDGSVYPFIELFNSDNESDSELKDLIKNYLESHGRRLGIFYERL